MNGNHQRNRYKYAVPIAALAVAGGAVIATNLDTDTEDRSSRHGNVTITKRDTPPQGSRQEDTTIRPFSGRRSQSASRPSNELHGRASPRVVEAQSGDFLVYTTWKSLHAVDPAMGNHAQGIEPDTPLGIPEVRVVDKANDDDRVLETGAYSTAVSAAGRVGYVRRNRAEVTADDDFAGMVVVRESLHADPVVWTSTPARYSVVAWAGRTLLVYRIGALEEPSVLALDGPGQERVVAEGLNLGALSPDGTLAALVDQVFVDDDVADDVPIVTVVRLADLTTIATLTAGTVRAQGMRGVLEGGEWLEDRLVLPSQSGALLLRFDGQALSITDTLQLDRATYPLGTFDAAFLDPGRVVLWAAAPVTRSSERGKPRRYQSFTLDCDVRAHSCDQSRDVDPLRTAPISNRSRPGSAS